MVHTRWLWNPPQSAHIPEPPLVIIHLSARHFATPLPSTLSKRKAYHYQLQLWKLVMANCKGSDGQANFRERKKEKALTTFPACLASWILLSHTALETTPSTAPWSPAIISGVSGYHTTAQHRAYQIPAISNKRHTLWQNIRCAETNYFRHAWLTILQTLATGSVWPETLFHDKLLQKQKFKVRCNPCWW